VLAVLALAITVMPVISTPVAAAGAVITSATGKWVVINGSYYFEVDYTAANVNLGTDTATLYTATSHSFVSVRAASSGSLLVPESDILNYYTVGVDSYLILDIAGATTAIPITMYNVTSNFGSSYVSGEPVGAVTGTVTAFNKTSAIVTSTVSTPTLGLALVAVWEDEDGNTHSASVPNGVLTATVLSDGKTATFAVKAGDIRFTVPAGNVYLVSKNIADDMGSKGTVYGVSVAKYAYKTITITQGKLVANPSTVNAPVTGKEIYFYDQFGYPLANTKLNVQYGYKDVKGNTIVDKQFITDSDGKAKIDFPQPYAFGTYTATISTFKSGRYVDGVVALTVTYAGGFSLGEMAKTGSIGALTIPVNSTSASINKLWISVDDTNKVLKTYYYSAANDDLVDYKLKPTGYTTKFEYANDGACGVTVTDFYWVGNSKNVTLTGTALQGGTFTVTAKAELSDGSIVTASKQYIVKAYRIESITPASTTYGTATTVKIVVKDWYGSPVDNLKVKLENDNNSYILIPGDYGTYTYTIPGAATPGKYDVYVSEDGSNWEKYNKSFYVDAALDLKVTAPATVNAMSSFNVAVTDANGNPINGSWYVLDPYYELYTVADGYVVSGQFTVNTANFISDVEMPLPLGAYTLVIYDSDGAHRAKVTFNVIAPATITPTVVTNGLKSSFVVQMTATGMSASMLKLRETSRAVLQVVNDKFNPESATTISVPYYNLDVSDQTATITVTAHKMRACSNAVVRLLYGNFIIPTTVAVEHPQLSFVNTATLYAGDVVPVQVKLVDALGNPVKGAVIKLYQLGYYEYTATTNAEGIAEFGNITLSVAGNMVAELVFGPDQQKVEDYRLKGQTDNTNYKVTAQILPARPAQGLKVTVTPTIVDAGKDALLTLTLVGADDKPVETGKNVVVTIGPSTYNGLVGANGVVTLTVKSESLTGTVVTGVVKVEGYNAATFTLAVKEAEKPEVKTLIELAPGMDVYSVNGETKFWDATPYIKNGRTLVPIRHLAEAIGFKASWDFDDPANKMVFIFKADQDPEKDKEHPFILLIIGQPTAMVNGNLVALDVAPEILNGRTMVPLRFVVETLGYKVEWLGNTIRLMK